MQEHVGFSLDDALSVHLDIRLFYRSRSVHPCTRCMIFHRLNLTCVGFQVPALDLDWSSWHRFGLFLSWYAPSRGDHASAFVTIDSHVLYDLCLGKWDAISTLVSCLAIIQRSRLLLMSEEWFGIGLRNAILWFHVSTASSSFFFFQLLHSLFESLNSSFCKPVWWGMIGCGFDVTYSILFQESFKLFAHKVTAIVCNNHLWKSMSWKGDSQLLCGSFRSRSVHWECFYPLGVRINYDEQHFLKKWTSVV